MGLIHNLGSRMTHSNNRVISSIGIFARESLSKIYYYKEYHPFMSDRKYIELRYKKMFGVLPNLDSPHNFNEKNNWRKLHDRKPIYTSMVDKVKVKSIVRERLGNGYSFELLKTWKNPDDIELEDLPKQFVLKTNHAGGVIICRDKFSFDLEAAKKELKEVLKTNYYILSREWPYKNVNRMVLCEEYRGENLTDYKNYCFNGKLMYTLVWENHAREDGRKPEAHFCGAYDQNWVKTDMKIDYPSEDKDIVKPEGYDEMVRVAEVMSAGIPFVRVDCYIIDGHVYLGEMTFFPWGGFQKFKDENWNNKLGEMEILDID